MRTTITIRADRALHRALVSRAGARGMTVSALVREILAAALAESPMTSRVGHVAGRLRLDRGAQEPWRARLQERNWRS